ncbi:MAG: DUF4956 domain-containing protein [Spirochaetaceae bacterium]
MNFEQILLEIGYNNISIQTGFIRLITSGLLGFMISLIFKKYNTKEESQTAMIQSLIFLNMTICLAMMAIGNNLASAFGLVGAVSIIRFRTSVKSARDMAFVFFTIVIGMACGLGFILLSILSLLIVGSIMLLVFKTSYGHSKNIYMLFKLKVSYNDTISHRKNIENILKDSGIIFKVSGAKIEETKSSISFNIKLISIDDFEILSSKLYEGCKLNNLKLQLVEL